MLSRSIKIVAKKLGFGGTYCSGYYKSFDEAMSKTGISGYDDSGFVEGLKDKSSELNSNPEAGLCTTNDDQLILLSICFASQGDKINVLDIGGGFGIHYSTSKKFMPNKIMKWDIIETKIVVNQSASFCSANLNFFDSLSRVAIKDNNYDLAILVSSIQYLPNTESFVNELCNLKPKYILITRTPLGNKDSYVSVQRSKISSNYRGKSKLNASGNIYYPINILKKKALLDSFSDLYDIVFISENLKSHLYANWEELNVYNILLKLKNL